LRPDVADRLGDAGVSILYFAVDAWGEFSGLKFVMIDVAQS
jgi:hypothetical protein